jgi:seryl-tRNA synthetase
MIELIRENPKAYKDDMKKRFKDPSLIDTVLHLDEEWRKHKSESDQLRARRNKLSLEINELKKAKKDASKVIKEASAIPDRLKKLEEHMAKLEKELADALYRVPNLLMPKVPVGKDASENVEVKKWGKPKKFAFELKTHSQLAEDLGIADFEQGTIVAQRGFNYLFGQLAMLDMALQRYGIEFLVEKGFTPVVPPMMINRETLGGAVDLSAFNEVIYKVENEDLYLIGTAEHALVTSQRNKTLQEKNLPLKICAVTPCFRKEIGAHGVDTKGLFRMHQFNKVEQVVFCKPEDSPKMHEEMEAITEEFFRSLEIPFRVIELCTGDLGPKFAKQYDIEAWFPRQNEYKEITSAGNCTDYQARRLNIKYLTGTGKRYPHILNNTMVATSRAMVAILENFQNEDGTVTVPKVLQKYTGFKVIGKPAKKK